MADAATNETLHRTPLFDLHREIGGRMVPFAGYEMPVQFEGILAEHNWTRENAGLFDVSHMGQTMVRGADADEALERLVPGSIRTLKPGSSRYTLLLNEEGGIIDDLIVTRPADADGRDRLWLVLNAARKAVDRERIASANDLEITPQDDRALLALQGPKAETVLARLFPEVAELRFMSAAPVDWNGEEVLVFRCGYTGEDGFEISMPGALAEDFARVLLSHAEVKSVGLGARDSLRLEAGLPLYGHDIDETTSPVEAGLAFAIGKARRESGGFPGEARILAELRQGPKRSRIGLLPEGRAPVREGAAILHDGQEVGTITSGGFGPSIGVPVAMGYVPHELAETGTILQVEGRRGSVAASVAALPFIPSNTKR